MTARLEGADLAVEVLNQIEASPQNWDQTAWRSDKPGSSHSLESADGVVENCETAFCFAGWVAVLDDVQWLNGEEIRSPWSTIPFRGVSEIMDRVPVSHYARQRLGLDNDEADLLFAVDNTIETLRSYVNQMKDGQSLEAPLESPGEEWN